MTLDNLLSLRQELTTKLINELVGIQEYKEKVAIIDSEISVICSRLNEVNQLINNLSSKDNSSNL